MSGARMVKIGAREIQVEGFSGRKAIRAGKLVREILKRYPQVLEEMAEFTTRYQEKNVLWLERTEARFRLPEATAHMTDADWEASDGKLAMRQSPTEAELFMSVFPTVFDAAEELALQLCALPIVSNDELAQAARNANGPEAITDLLNERGERLLDEASYDQLVDLVLSAAEAAHEQIAEKLEGFKERAGKLRRLLGWSPEPEETPTTPEPTSTTSGTSGPGSSTDSPAPTDGEPTSPSTESPSGSSAALTPA